MSRSGRPCGQYSNSNLSSPTPPQTKQYGKYTDISPKFQLLLLTQHLGDAKNVVITDRILKFLKMLVYGTH